MSEPDETRPAADVTGILSTPVYGEALAVLHVAPTGRLTDLAAAVAAVQAAAGWRSTVLDPGSFDADEAGAVDVVVLWGPKAGEARALLAGRQPTVVVLDAVDVRTLLTRPARWLAELRAARYTNLLLVPAGLAERYTRWGPPVPLVHRPEGLPDTAAVTVLSAWVARAYAFGRRYEPEAPTS